MLTGSPTDVLSHVAIRARSQGVLLATCFDEAELGNLEVCLSSHRSLHMHEAPQAHTAFADVMRSTSSRCRPLTSEYRAYGLAIQDLTATAGIGW